MSYATRRTRPNYAKAVTYWSSGQQSANGNKRWSGEAIEKAIIEIAPEATGIEYELPPINLTVGNAVPVEFSRRPAPGGAAANGGGVSISIGRKPQ